MHDSLGGITATPLAAHGAVSVFGAVVHALNAQRNGETKNFVDVITLTVISSFSGVMFSLVGLHFFGEASYFTLAIAGSGGFLGVEGMGVVVRIVKRSLEVNLKR